MNRSVKTFFAFLALSILPAYAATPFYSNRPQAVNAAREMVGWERDIDRCTVGSIYGSFNATLEWSQTFNPNSITQCIFGSSIACDDCKSSILIQGSQVADRNEKAWLADYFGLPMDFESTISFKPRISNCIADLQFWVGLDELASGVYFRLHTPISYTKWSLNPQEIITHTGSLDYPIGYFAPTTVTNNRLLDSALDFFNGTQVPTLPDNVAFQKLAYSKWASGCTSLTKTRLADVEFELGWNFLCNDYYLVGIGLRGSAPTGNKPNGNYLFEPIAGCGGHWKFGASFDAHAIFWCNEGETNSLGVYMDANIQHLFDVCQRRTFDLCTSGSTGTTRLENSRYMLAQRLQNNTDTATAHKVSPGIYEFADEFAPVANLTTHNVNVSVAFEVDVAAMISYKMGNLNCNIGYELYSRSCEKIKPETTCAINSINNKIWALKGDSQVIGFNGADTVNLAATQSLATIYSGVNNFAVDTSAANRANVLTIDNPVFATANSNPVTTIPSGDNQTRTSNSAILLTRSNVNFSGTQATSNKVFTHINYAWKNSAHWTPYLGVGAEAEFGHGSCATDCNSCTTSCNGNCCTGHCYHCVPSQWGVWLKGGASFD